tara:strand:+ start:1560 stop:1775 length:216 start_codon:yes stop_codon:yes gene_type:complete
MTQANDISEKRKHRMDVRVAFDCYVKAGIDPADIVFDRGNDRIFVKKVESIQTMTHEGSKSDWAQAIKAVK